jgi:hypothetical protein
VTRPRPTPRPRPKLAVPQKSEDKPATPQKQITYHGQTYVRHEEPVGFETAMFCKTGVDLAPASEQSAVSK